MSDNEEKIYVYENFSSSEPILLGTLFCEILKGNPIYSFEYDENYLKNSKHNIMLDPEINFYKGRQYPHNKKFFGIFEDISPDRWGRLLINRNEAIKGNKKKNVVDTDGTLYIAKFPSKNDIINVGAWEKVSYELAKLVGLNVMDTRLLSLSENGDTILIKRFDRENGRRIHFASAMTMLCESDGSNSDESYLDIVFFIKAYGNNVKDDLLELYKRVAFNMCIKNTDDHLRNHGFLLNHSWQLSPLYDINPDPYGKNLSLNIDMVFNDIDLELLLETSKYYDLKLDSAKAIVEDIKNIISKNWYSLAKKIVKKNGEIEYMAEAFIK